MGSTGVVRRIIIGKRRGVLEYTVFTKDEKPVNLLNLQTCLTYEDAYKGKMAIFCFQTSRFRFLSPSLGRGTPEGQGVGPREAR